MVAEGKIKNKGTSWDDENILYLIQWWCYRYILNKNSLKCTKIDAFYCIYTLFQ